MQVLLEGPSARRNRWITQQQCQTSAFELLLAASKEPILQVWHIYNWFG